MASGDQVLLLTAGIAEQPKGLIAASFEFQERVRESDRCIRQAWRKATKYSMEIGWEGAFLRFTKAWPVLGFYSERDYRASVRIGRSTWFKMVSLAECFRHLTKEQFLSMSIENAELLSVAPLEVRKNLMLVQYASIQTKQQFSDELTLETAQRENTPLTDTYVLISWRVKEAQREAIAHAVKDWQAEHGIDDEGYALGLMVSELHDRPILVGFLTESIPLLTQAVANAQASKDTKELLNLLAAHIVDMKEILRICSGETWDYQSRAA